MYLHTPDPYFELRAADGTLRKILFLPIKLFLLFLSFLSLKQCSGGSCPPPPPRSAPSIRPDACLRLKFLHRQDRIFLLNWLIFLMKRALHFATKLNSRDIEKCNCFGYPPMICVTATGGRECGGEVTCHEKSSTVLSEPKFGPPPPHPHPAPDQKFLDPPL